MNKHKQLLKIGREVIGHGCMYSEYSGPGRRRIAYHCGNRNGEHAQLVLAIRAAGFGPEVNVINANTTQSGWPMIRILYPAEFRDDG